MERHDFDDVNGSGLLAAAAVDPCWAILERDVARQARRRHRRIALVVALVVLLFAGAIAAQAAFTEPATPGTGAPVATTSEAVGVVVLRPRATAERVAVARAISEASARETAASALHLVGDEGALAIVKRVTTDSRLTPESRAESFATAEDIQLLEGRIRITGARMSAVATIRDGTAGGQIALAPTTRVIVDGSPIDVETANHQIAVEGVGTVTLNEQAVVAAAPTGDRQTGPRYRIVGALAHIRLTHPSYGLPAGSELVIGKVDAGIRQGKIRQIAHAAQPTNSSSGAGDLPRRATSVRANPGVSSSGLSKHLFPVLGRHDYSNDWGAPRASTGVPHQGTDIFANEGTPLIAVADGTLNRVGWNTFGGYRLWLEDRDGNAFYYAHMSAYSPIAADGVVVRAGDVIGFVGHTGDARSTPSHVHFEIHPGGRAATNPFPIINAWRRGVASAISLSAQTPQRVAGATLLTFSDISPNSGLQQSVLDEVPSTQSRPIEQETAPVPTDDSLRSAIEGPAISGP